MQSLQEVLCAYSKYLRDVFLRNLCDWPVVHSFPPNICVTKQHNRISLSINSIFLAPHYVRTLFGVQHEHSFLYQSAKKSEQELKDEEMELFTKYYMEWKGGKKSDSTSYANIPRFYYRVSEVSR